MARNEFSERPLGCSAGAAEMPEVELVVLDPSDREGEIDLQRTKLGEGLVRGGEIGLGQPP